MNCFRHIFIAFLCLLAASSVAQAQNDWDSVLDRYEKITLQCMSLRDKAAAGERVSQKSVTELFGELNRLRNSLQQASGKMTAKQRERFRRVRESYDGKMDGQDGTLRLRSGTVESRSGTVDRNTAEASSHQPVGERSRTTGNNMVEPLPKVEGWPVVLEMMGEEILRSAQNDNLSRNNTPVILNGAAGEVLDPQTSPTRAIGTTETAGTMAGKHLTFNAIPTLSIGDTRQGGIFLSLSRGRLGGYLSARTNFVSQLYAYECLSDGTTPGPETFKGKGGQRIGEYSLSVGAVINALPWLSFFSGAGFGSSTLCWNDSLDAWARVKDYSASGLQVEGGMVFHLWNFSLLGGVSQLTARPSSGPFMPVFTLGAGIRF
ncbi:MAG: hypothetical protein IJK32_09230 [Bacteroidales bacterium]|nr:hypothetical protein [Bacteroidales bacterium]